MWGMTNKKKRACHKYKPKVPVCQVYVLFTSIFDDDAFARGRHQSSRWRKPSLAGAKGYSSISYWQIKHITVLQELKNCEDRSTMRSRC